MYAVEYVMRRETHADGSATVTETITVTGRPVYRQDWPAYNTAQTTEKDHFQVLLRDLCQTVEEPPRGMGRPRLSRADAIFAAAFKVYSTVSGRRFMSDLRAAADRGHVARVPCYNTIFNYLDDATMTPVLSDLITASSLPLRSVESTFAIDSTGFTTSRFTRWFDHKYGCVRNDHDWVKAHFVCGVKTNVVTAVEIHDRNASDTPRLPSLLDATARHFDVRELCADKAYASVGNFAAMDRHGVAPLVAFKSHHTGKAGGLFAKAYHYFCFRRDEFMARHHQRSNVESTVNMVKAKFRDHVRSRTDTAMRNEVLCKFLCHNLCCLVGAFHELGIDPAFAKAG